VEPEAASTSVLSAGVQRSRTTLANAGHAARRALERVRGREQSVIEQAREPGVMSAEDETLGSSTDLADADPSVQRVWRRVRLAIAIVVTVVPIVTALISWRIRVSRARRRGRLIDL
jgi:hypothetical protein